MNQQQLQEVYQMVDSIPLSRAKKNISRDFSDGLMMAEVIHHFNPKIVAVHNYPPSNAVSKKIVNWNTLNNKVFKKIGISLNKQQIQDIANSVSGAIEQVLYQVLVRFQKPDEEGRLTQNVRHLEQRSVQREMHLPNQSIENRRVEQINNGTSQHYDRQMTFVEGRDHRKGAQENEEATELIDKIQRAYSQLIKLTELNKAKEQMLRNLQKKLDKILLN